MRIFKSTYRDRDGVKRQTLKFYIEVRDHLGLVRRLPAFSDRRLSESLGRSIQSLVNCRKANLDLDAGLNRWLETLSGSLLAKLVAWGLIDGQRAEITKPLAEHIRDYAEVLKAKGYSGDYVVRTRNRLRKIVSDCRFYYFRDITQSAVEIYLGKLKKDGYGDTSRGHYLDALKTFLNWTEQNQRISRNPVARMKKPKRDEERKGVLTPEQFIHLVKATSEKNVLIGRSNGAERAMLYLLAGMTGLRRKELLGLTWSNIYLGPDNAFVRVPAKLAKNAKEADQPVPPATVAILQTMKAQARPNEGDRVFACLNRHVNTAAMLRRDFETAGLPLTDREGNAICFHSLRNSYISFLANTATPAKTIQKLARHSDPKLTFNTYARSFEVTEQEAVKQLPDMTDFAGQFVLASCLALQGAQLCPTVTSPEKVNAIYAKATAFLAQEPIPPRGVEPLLPG